MTPLERQIIAAHKADPTQTDQTIADLLRCHRSYVGNVRLAAGLKKPRIVLLRNVRLDPANKQWLLEEAERENVDYHALLNGIITDLRFEWEDQQKVAAE